MTKSVPLPKWIMTAYSVLWVRFKNAEFTYENASKTINKKQMTSILLSQMKKNSWLTIRLDEKDSRKRIYKLISPEEVITKIGNEE